MNTLKKRLVMWGMIFPFHTLMQEKTVAKEFEFNNNNMYVQFLTTSSVTYTER
jgi:hypothetical protein